MKSILPYFVYSINETTGQLTFVEWKDVDSNLIQGFIALVFSYIKVFFFFSVVFFFVLLAWEVIDSYFFGNKTKGDNLICGTDDEEY